MKVEDEKKRKLQSVKRMHDDKMLLEDRIR